MIERFCTAFVVSFFAVAAIWLGFSVAVAAFEQAPMISTCTVVGLLAGLFYSIGSSDGLVTATPPPEASFTHKNPPPETEAPVRVSDAVLAYMDECDEMAERTAQAERHACEAESREAVCAGREPEDDPDDEGFLCSECGYEDGELPSRCPRCGYPLQGFDA